MEIKRLNKNDIMQYFNLIKITEGNLKNSAWWLPIHQEEINEFFNENITYLYGIYNQDKKLIASCGLFLGWVKMITKHLNLDSTNVGEIGRCMVDPNYIGNGYMRQINEVILEKANELGLDYLLATVHPDNIYSLNSLEKLDFEGVKTVTKEEGYKRLIMVRKMKNNLGAKI